MPSGKAANNPRVVGNVFGQRYSMRLWIDPVKLIATKTITDIKNVLIGKTLNCQGKIRGNETH
jgi:hypothetical protein